MFSLKSPTQYTIFNLKKKKITLNYPKSESRRKVGRSRLGFAMRRLENSVNSAVNEYLFRIRKDKAAKEEGWAPPFTSCAQDTVGL